MNSVILPACVCVSVFAGAPACVCVSACFNMPAGLCAGLTLLVFVSVCALSDYLTGRIPNTLILCGVFCAIVSRAGMCVSHGMTYLFFRCVPDMAAGFLLPYLLLGPLVILSMLGAGDVKLLSVIGLQLGWRGSLTMLWYSLAVAAGVSILIVARRRNLAQRLEYLWRYVGNVASGGKVVPYRNGSGDYTQSGEFAFAIPVFLALVVYLARCAYG